MRSQLKHISLTGMLFFSAILMQGCSVLAWVGIVCADVATCSDVEFEPFEHAWVAPPEARQQVPLKHIAVAPFVGIYAWLTGGRPCSDKQTTVT